MPWDVADALHRSAASAPALSLHRDKQLLPPQALFCLISTCFFSLLPF